ncbi:MAG: hypothetical protein QNI94_08570 [Kiloniellales bacterium]|nr:hypothetical protein [Kiloniellales bacterium]
MPGDDIVLEWLQSPVQSLLLLQKQVQQALGGAFREASASDDGLQAAVLVLLALVFGMLHAIGPGHGKSVMVAYFVGQAAPLRQGLLASVKLIAVHVGSAILLVLAAVALLDISFGLRPADFPLVRQVSYAGVAAVGLFLLVQAVRGDTRAKGGGVLPYVVGLSPCPLTTIMMLAAVGTGAIALGLIVSVAMALGMVVTVSAFALLAILARRWLLAVFERHQASIRRIGRGFEVFGALAVTALGLLLLAGEFA